MPDQTHELSTQMTSSNTLLTFGYSTLANRVKNIQFPQKADDREFIVLVKP